MRPAVLDQAGRYTDWLQVADWLVAQVGGRPFTIPVAGALAWRLDDPDMTDQWSGDADLNADLNPLRKQFPRWTFWVGGATGNVWRLLRLATCRPS